MVVELGRGLRDVVQQTVLTEDSYAVKSIGGPLAEVLEKLRLLNEFLSEDRHPLHVWAVFLFVFFLAVAGAAMFAPLVNPYEKIMTKEEKSRTWENWTRRKRLLYYLARRFPKSLSYFYRQTFLSVKHGRIEKWLAVSLGKKTLCRGGLFSDIFAVLEVLLS